MTTDEKKHGDEVRKVLRGCMWEVSLVWNDPNNGQDWEVDYTVGPFQSGTEAEHDAFGLLILARPKTAKHYEIVRLNPKR